MHTQHGPVYPTPQGALFQKYVASLTAELLPASEQAVQLDSNLKGSLSKLSMASTGSSSSAKEYAPITSQSVAGGRRMSPWASSGVLCTSTGSHSRETSPASIDNLSMDELDVETTEEVPEETIL